LLAFEKLESHGGTSSRLEVNRVSVLDIGEVSQRAGVAVSTLRFYEEKGLIASVGRRGLRRQFDAGVLERLALIGLGRTAGFSLKEIVRMFAPDGQPSLDRQMLTHKADELDRTIRRLSGLRDGLRHAAACPAPRHVECPTFQRILKAVATGAIRVQEEDSQPGNARKARRAR
jgi:DNA-binding transcriptional MerR regulator